MPFLPVREVDAAVWGWVQETLTDPDYVGHKLREERDLKTASTARVEQELEYVQAPMLFSTREAAEKEKRTVEDAEPEGYSRLADQYGEELVNEAYDNTASLRTMWLDWDSLLDKLEDSDFLCVMVDHKLKLRQDFAEELRKKLEELEGEEEEE
jgi:hypothetical protein